MQFCQCDGGVKGWEERQEPCTRFLWQLPPGTFWLVIMGYAPPQKKKKKILHPPNAHMNTVSTVKEGKSVGEGGRCKAWGRENEAEMDGNKVALCLGQRRKGQRKGKKSQNKGVLSQMQL